jgi:hypothetical protein
MGRWAETFHFHTSDTLCSSRMEIKHVSSFVDDYSKALKEIGWYPPGNQNDHRRVEIAVLWECGGVDVRQFMPGDENIFYDPKHGYEFSHGDGCEHGWSRGEL